MNLSTKQKQTHRHGDRIVVAKEEGVDREFGVNKCKLFHLEWISNGDLLYSTGNYTEFPGIDHNGR